MRRIGNKTVISMTGVVGRCMKAIRQIQDISIRYSPQVSLRFAIAVEEREEQHFSHVRISKSGNKDYIVVGSRNGLTTLLHYLLSHLSFVDPEGDGDSSGQEERIIEADGVSATSNSSLGW